MFTLADVKQTTGGTLIAGHAAGAFTGVSIDSRNVKPGHLFVAFRGEQVDGHDYVVDAFRRGAYGALVEHLPNGIDVDAQHSVVQVSSTGQALTALATWWRERHQIRVVGVTGSVGKTTAKEVIAGVLDEWFAVLRTPANLNTELGLALCLMEMEPSHQVGVFEMAMNDVGEIAQLAEMAHPEVGVVVNVFPTHLERLGTIERIAQAKGELVHALPPHGLAILNADDNRVRAMAEWSPAPVLQIGTSSAADLMATEVEPQGLSGTKCTFTLGEERANVRMSLRGGHTVYAAMAAIGAAMHLGVAFRDAVARLEHVEPGPRLEVIQGRNGVTIIDDSYNASPASVIAALDLLEQMPGRRVAVLGDMLELGAYEEEGHRSVGRRAGKAADWLLLVGERATLVADQARADGMPGERVEWFETKQMLMTRLEGGLLPGDHVLVKASRGMHLDQIVAALQQPAQER